ncbi:hypothetical protein ACFLZY_00910 [Patescibacteria group bacterium]
MMSDLTLFTWFLALIWFIFYWIFGGVFFAVMALLRLGRVRKVRFSCLFSVLTVIVAFGTAFSGMNLARDAQTKCLLQAENKAEIITAIFGCGAAGVFGTFLLGAAVLILGGFLIMALSKSHSKPWITFDHEEETERTDQASKPEKHQPEGKYFN